MKNTIFASVCCTLALSFAAVKESTNAAQQPDQNQCVVLTYSKPVEGFDVKVFWRPRERMAGYVIGPAIVEFEHTDPHKTFSVTNNRFGLPDDAEWTKTARFVDGYFSTTSKPQIVLDYVAPKITDRLPSTSFFFVDLDFDGKKELVLTEIANGQRWSNTFRVHRPHDTMRRAYENSARVPLDSLDTFSRIDLKKRTIRIFRSGGAQVNDQLLYKFDDELNRYRLKTR